MYIFLGNKMSCIHFVEKTRFNVNNIINNIRLRNTKMIINPSVLFLDSSYTLEIIRLIHDFNNV